MLSNVECLEDRNENVFPRKPKPELKIDAAVALIVAMSRVVIKEDGPVDGCYDLGVLERAA